MPVLREVGEVPAGEHRLDPGEGERGLRAYAPYAGVGERGPEHPHPQLPRELDVVDEVAEPAQQAAVL